MLASGQDLSKILCSCLCHIKNERISKSMIVKSINYTVETLEAQTSKHRSTLGFASFLEEIGKRKPTYCVDAIPAIKHSLFLEVNVVPCITY